MKKLMKGYCDNNNIRVDFLVSQDSVVLLW